MTQPFSDYVTYLEPTSCYNHILFLPFVFRRCPALPVSIQKLSPVAIIVLCDGFHKPKITNLPTNVKGLMIVRSRAVFNEICDTAVFTDQHIRSKHVIIYWFSKILIQHFNQIVDESACRFLSYELFEQLIDYWDGDINISTIPSIEPTHSWNWRGYLAQWSYAVPLRRSLDQLTCSEQMWLHRMIFLMFKCNRRLASTYIYDVILSKIKRNERPPVEDIVDVNTYTESRNQRVLKYAIMNPSLHEDIFQQVVWYENKYTSICRRFQETFCAGVDSVRKCLDIHYVYASQQLTTAAELIKNETPTDLFDDEKTEVWFHLIQKTLKEITDSVYDRIYADVSAVSEYRDLRLYGNIYGRLTTLQKRGLVMDMTIPKFIEEHQRTLSNKKIIPVRFPGSGVRDDEKIRDYFYPNITDVSERLVECAMWTSPVWSIHTTSGMSYSFLRPCTSKKRTFNQVECTIDEFLDTFYNDDKHLAEYMRSNMDVSVVIFDIDIKTSNVESLSVDDMVRDIIALAKLVYSTIFGTKPQAHVVYKSTRATADKLGLHYHFVLPLGTVFTTEACRQFAVMLDVARYRYPETIGAQLNVHSIFDSGIYPLSDAWGYPHGHCIRGPHQTKSNGTCKLVEIYREGLVHNMAKFAHSPQYDAKGDRILMGNVVKRFDNFNDIRDNECLKYYQMNATTDALSSMVRSTFSEIVDEINKCAIVLPDNVTPTDVERLIQEQWKHNNGFKEHIESMYGSHSMYSAEIRKHICVTYNKHTERFHLANGSTGIRLRYCARKVHRNVADTHCYCYLAFCHKMIRFVLFCKCFKSSCRQLSPLVPNVHASLEPLFITKSIRQKVAKFIATLGSFHVIVRVLPNGNTVNDEQVDFFSTTYISQAGKINGIVRLYMFLHDNALLVKVFLGNTYVYVQKDVGRFVISDNYSSLLNYVFSESLINENQYECLQCMDNSKNG